MKTLTSKKRAVLVGLLCGGMLVSAVTGGTLYASAATVAPSFAIKETASIRTEAPAGIRFETMILKTEYEALKSKNAVYGTVINSQNMLGDKELTLGVDGAVDVKATNWKLSMTDDEKTKDIDESLYNQYNTVLVGDYNEETGTYAGLPEEMYGVKLVARSYVTYMNENGDSVTEYGEKQSIRSISDVAKGAIMDPNGGYSSTEYTYFHSITDYVAKQNTMDTVAVNVALEAVNAVVPVSATYGEVKAVYAVEEGTYTELEAGKAWTYADETLTFANDYLKSLSYGDYSLKVFAEKDVFELPMTIYGESTLGYARTLGFDSNYTIKNVKNSAETSEVEWLADFEGAKGVMHIKNSGASTGYTFVSDYTVAELQAMEWDYIEYRVYLKNTTDTPWSYCSWNGDKSLGALKVGEWNTVRITKADLTTLFGDNIDSFYGVFNKAGEGFKTFWAYGTAGADVYFDYVALKENADPSYFDFADPSSAEVNFDGSGPVWLSSYEGANGVLKGSYADMWGKAISFKLDTTAEKLEALNWEYVEFKVACDFEGGKRTSWDGLTSGSAGWTYTTDGVWRIYKAYRSGLITQFGSIEDFYKAVTTASARMFTLWNLPDHGNFYFDYFKFGSYDRVMDFETEDEISFLRSGTDAKWLESSTCDKGVTENGVISYYHGTTQYAGVKFQFNNYTNMTLDDWDKIQIRIRIIRGSNSSQKGTDGSFGTFYMGNTSISIGSVNNGWSTLTITKAQIEASDQYSVESFWTAFTSQEGARLFWCYYVWDAADWTIQSASISLLKN